MGTAFIRLIKKGLSKKVKFKQKPERREETNYSESLEGESQMQKSRDTKPL